MTPSSALIAQQPLNQSSDTQKKIDTIIQISLWIHFLTGILLSVVHATHLVAFALGALCLTAYYMIKLLLPGNNLYQYALAMIYGIFSAQFIYAMQGAPQTFFSFLLGSTLLLLYQNWKLQIPLLLFVMLHNGIVVYLQNIDQQNIYTPISLADFAWYTLLTTAAIGINAGCAYFLKQQTETLTHTHDEFEQQAKNVSGNISFAEEIAKGNLGTSYIPNENDMLGKSLIKMRDSLLEAAVREQKEKYITQGIAMIGDILRKHNDDLAKLSDELTREIVNYTSSNQGGLFLLDNSNNSDPHLNLMACYAYSRKKFMEKRIEIGSTLVGQCFLEKEMILLKQVPENYIHITSGLGMAPPTNVILMPVSTNEEVTGVLELASFNTYDERIIEFLKKATEAIAVAALSARTTEHIKKLLSESQQNTEEMRAQEEEMRQNMEELEATQEEMHRKNAETENRMKALDESGIASIEFNLDGTIITANDNFLKLMEYSIQDIRGKHHRIFVDERYAESAAYAKFWEDLNNGIPRPGEYERRTRSGKKVYIKGSYSIIRDQNDHPVRIIKMATDITSLVHQQEEIQRKNVETEYHIKAMNESGIASIEFNLDGTIITANDSFLKLMEYQLHEIQGKHHRIFVDPSDANSAAYKTFWDDLRNGISRPGEYERVTKTGKKIYIKGSYSIIRDEKFNPVKILKLANDITPYILHRDNLQHIPRQKSA